MASIQHIDFPNVLTIKELFYGFWRRGTEVIAVLFTAAMQD
jgi:hypothetical protein